MVTIHQFNPEVYPFLLWVAITKDVEAIKEKFCEPSGGELQGLDILHNSDAISFFAVRKEDLRRGGIIIFREKSKVTVSNITHEACHISDIFWERMGEQTIGAESNAYLTGWIAQCCDNVRKYKPSKDGQTNNPVD